MRATIDHRGWNRYHGGLVKIEMGLDEFRETVEWLEMIDPNDGCTHDWRAQLDRLDPPTEEEDLSDNQQGG